MNRQYRSDRFQRHRQRLLLVLLQLAAYAQISFADTVRILDDDENALRTRIALIDNAQQQIDYACFELRRDLVSYGVLAHLQLAARRSVKVRLVIDAYGNKIDASILTELVQSGVEIRRFHSFQLKSPGRYLHRLHDKLLIADRRVMLIGGRNLGAVYYGRSSKSNFVDFEIELTGSAVKDAGLYFEQLWSCKAVVPVCGCSQAATRCRQQTFDAPPGVVYATSTGLLRRGYCTVRWQRSTTWKNPTLHLDSNQIQFHHSNRATPGCSPDVTDALLTLINFSCREIVITTPYLTLSKRMEQSLCAAAQRGVSIRLLGNSLASIDKPVAHAGYINQKSKMLSMGIELWEFQGIDMLHAKLMIIDSTAVIGSYDLHPRSEHYDSETAVLISNPKVSTSIRAVMRRLFTRAVQVNRSPGYRHSRSKTGFPASTRIFKMHMLRLPAALIKKHL